MRGTTTLLLAVLNTISAAKPLRNRDLAKFPAGSVFDIVLQRSKVSDADLKGAKGTVIDVDLEDNYRNGAKTTIGDLAKVKTVICYFSAGSYENWRSDKDKFLPSDYGKNMTWPGENWINVKSDNVKKIMAARIEQAAKAGCHAVDPDNVDGFVSSDWTGRRSSGRADSLAGREPRRLWLRQPALHRLHQVAFRHRPLSRARYGAQERYRNHPGRYRLCGVRRQ